MKKQSDLSRLMGYAGNYRYFTYASWVLSAVSALMALIPFLYIWMILRDVPEYGYSLPIARRLNIDFTIGAGYWGGIYHEYKPEADYYVWQSFGATGNSLFRIISFVFNQ